MERKHSRIVIDPNICHGKPVVEGTRTPVSTILSHLAGGDSIETICREYDLTKEDIQLALSFANDELSRITFIPTLTPTGS